MSPTAAAASPMSSPASVRPARRSRIEVSPSAFDSFAPSGVGGRAGGGRRSAAVSRPSRRPSRIWAGVAASRSRPRIDEVDALTEVVDDDREAVRPVAVAVTDRQVAAGAATSSAHGPTSASIQRSRPAAERDAQRRAVDVRDRRQSPGQPGPCHGRPWSSAHAANVAREQSQP